MRNQRTFHCLAAPAQDMDVKHGGGNIVMCQRYLKRTNIRAARRHNSLQAWGYFRLMACARKNLAISSAQLLFID